MANYRATSAGVWNNLAIWEDDSSSSYNASTVLPTVGDVVYSNNFRVTLNTDIAVSVLKNTASTNVNVGGDFYVRNVNRTIFANVESENNWCLNLQNGMSGENVTITLYGNVTSGNQAAIYCRSDGVNMLNFVMYGNINPNESIAGIDIQGTGAGRIVNITIVGNGNGRIVNNIGVVTFANVNITGVFTAGAFDSFPSVRDSFTAVGIFTASATNNICVGAVTCVANISGLIENVNSRMAFVFNSMYLSPTASLVWKTYDSNNDAKFLYTEDAFDFPSESDVKDGVSFASGTKTGTLAVEQYLALPISLQERLENVATTEQIGQIWSND